MDVFSEKKVVDQILAKEQKDAMEATRDFWRVSGNFIYRHHVMNRAKLDAPRKESFRTPLKYLMFDTLKQIWQTGAQHRQFLEC